jgi:pyruvate/2-oxoglutarate dehydrogenase complex dihydrolipoamide dehydrogenase (E3) component
MEARERYGDGVRILTAAFADNDRAVTEQDQRGFAKLIATRGGKLVGVTIVGAHAGELIQPWVIAMSSGLSLRKMASFVPPYPTRGEFNRTLAGQWFAGRLFSPTTRALVGVLKHLR